MKKCLFLLALLAFTQNVNADYAPIDIQIAEGEEYQIDNIIAAQVVNQTSWDGQYILTGGIARVYIDFLPRDGYPSENSRNFYPLYVEQKQNGSWWLYDSVSTQKYVIPFNSPWDAYQWLISNDGQKFCKSMFIISDDEDGNGEYLSLGDFLLVGYSNTSSQSPSQDTQKYNLENIALANNRNRFLTSSDLLEYAQVPINGVKITITNSQGQATSSFDTNMVVKLDQILQQVIRIKSDTSTIVSELMFLANAFGFDGEPGSSTSNLAEFLGQWRTADGVWQGEIFDVITNFANQADYTDWFRLMLGADPYSTNRYSYIELYNKLLAMERLAKNGRYSLTGTQPYLALYGVPYSTWSDKVNSLNNAFFPNDQLISYEALSSYLSLREQYQNQYIEYRKYGQLTNIIDGIDLGRDWLTLATNDVSSLPYWLNQQDYSSAPPIGVTNFQANTRWSVLTNQYAQIGLNGQAANGTDQWNYFKRLEMLLAALVYKPEDEGEKLSNDMNSQSSDAETKKQDVKNSLDGLLNSFGGQKTLLQGQTSSFLSALGRVNEMFDQTWTPGQWRYWKDDAEDGGSSSSGGASGSSVELWIDFSDSKYQFIFDFIRSLCGFVWSFFSLLIIYKFAIFAYKLGMKFARVAYSILRHMFGQ